MLLGLRAGLSAKRRRKAGKPNLMAGLPWIQGSNTTMSIANGRVQAAFNGGNPRAYKQVDGLVIGRNYRVSGKIYQGVGAQNMFFRVGTAADIPAGDAFQVQSIADVTINDTFTAPAATLFIGVVGIRGTGEHVAIDENFSLTSTV